MKSAGILLLISAALHVIGVVLAGFSPDALILLVPAAFYLFLVAGLSRGIMWIAWLAFICMLGGAAGALAAIYGGWSIPAWVFVGIFMADLAAAVLLFLAIWSGPSHSDI